MNDLKFTTAGDYMSSTHMNERIRTLLDQAQGSIDPMDETANVFEKFAQSIVYDILSELTNDDDLGSARINTIRRLAQRYGVER